MSERYVLDPEKAVLTLQEQREREGAIQISITALIVAFNHCRSEKERAILRGDIPTSIEWTNEVANMRAGIDGVGILHTGHY